MNCNIGVSRSRKTKGGVDPVGAPAAEHDDREIASGFWGLGEGPLETAAEDPQDGTPLLPDRFAVRRQLPNVLAIVPASSRLLKRRG